MSKHSSLSQVEKFEKVLLALHDAPDGLSQDELCALLAWPSGVVNDVLAELNFRRRVAVVRARKKGKTVTVYSIRRG